MSTSKNGAKWYCRSRKDKKDPAKPFINYADKTHCHVCKLPKGRCNMGKPVIAEPTSRSNPGAAAQPSVDQKLAAIQKQMEKSAAELQAKAKKVSAEVAALTKENKTLRIGLRDGDADPPEPGASVRDVVDSKISEAQWWKKAADNTDYSDSVFAQFGGREACRKAAVAEVD